jgi:large subunit ribosomal protein L29
MKNKEIKKLSTAELKKKVDLLKKDLFNFRFRKANGQVDDTAKISQTKKNLAKVLTNLNKNSKSN